MESKQNSKLWITFKVRLGENCSAKSKWMEIDSSRREAICYMAMIVDILICCSYVMFKTVTMGS